MLSELWMVIYDVLILLCVSAAIYYSLAIYATITFFTQSKIRSKTLDLYPLVTILKPICGLDSNAHKNLASFFQQDYPMYQIIFGVQDPNDPSIAIVQQLITDFPEIDI